MNGIDWTRCFHEVKECKIKLEDYYQNGLAVGEWKARLVEKIEVGLAAIERNLQENPAYFKKGDYSVYSGVCGVALLYLHVANTLYKDNKDRRKYYLDKAVELVSDPLKRLNGRRLTFLCGDGGVLALSAVLYSLTNHDTVVKHCCSGLLTLSDIALTDKSLSSELMYGTAGYLFALLYTKKYLPQYIDDKIICNLISHIFSVGKDPSLAYTSSPLHYTWHDKYYLGAAHGLAGILYTLLQSNMLPADSVAVVTKAVDFLLGQRFSSHNLLSSIPSQTDRLVQWCHGSPGLIPLLNSVYKIKGGTYLQESIKCASVVWKRGLLKKGHGLCHGTLGNTYAFLDLYQATDDIAWLCKAIQFTEWSMSHVDVKKKYENEMTLYDGLSGVVYFYCDMLCPKKACFPGFKIPM